MKRPSWTFGVILIALAGFLVALAGFGAAAYGQPIIGVSPSSLSSTQKTGQQVVQMMTIGNSGSSALDWGTMEATSNCGSPSDIPWASTSPITGTIGATGSQAIDVAFDSTGLLPGTYTGLLCVSSNDPAHPLIAVPLTLIVSLIAATPALSDVGLALTALALLAIAFVSLGRGRRRV